MASAAALRRVAAAAGRRSSAAGLPAASVRPPAAASIAALSVGRRAPADRRSAAGRAPAAASVAGGCSPGRRHSSSSSSSSPGPSDSSEDADGEPGAELNPETVSYLVDKTSTREVYLVGTAHVSEASAEDVRRTIRIAKPHGLMVELCSERALRLAKGESGRSPQELAKELFDRVLRGNAVPGFGVEMLLKMGLSTFYAVLRQAGLIPGTEFKAALEEGERLGIPVCLGDRPVDETMAQLRGALGHVSLERLSRAPPPPPALAAAFEGLASPTPDIRASVEALKNRRQIALARDYMTGLAPEVMHALVRERDVLMAEKLLTECRVGRIVAVVGMAHMDGIEDEWRRRGGEVFLHGENSLKKPP